MAVCKVSMKKSKNSGMSFCAHPENNVFPFRCAAAWIAAIKGRGFKKPLFAALFAALLAGEDSEIIFSCR